MKDTSVIPAGYKSEMDKRITERLVAVCQERFEMRMMKELNLQLVSSPLFLERNSGLNDDLNGVERPVSFELNQEEHLDVVHSLAKWKRNYLADPYYKAGEGIITRMNAIRRDEVLSNIHSYTVDQWDWERIIAPKDRSRSFLKRIVKSIYAALIKTQDDIRLGLDTKYEPLPDDVFFIQSEQLCALYPHLKPKQREAAICKEKGAVFIMGIGGALSDGEPHDLRAPDYDDWTSEEDGFKGLNGDLMVWNPVLQAPLELSSMGIRVDSAALQHQLELTEKKDRLDLPFHRKIMQNELPLTIGGGIGRSRVAMFLLEKAHIGEVQSSYWSVETRQLCKEKEVILL